MIVFMDVSEKLDEQLNRRTGIASKRAFECCTHAVGLYTSIVVVGPIKKRFCSMISGCVMLRVGAMAEWLCSGLQIRVARFDSGLRLQHITTLTSAGSG